MQIPTGITYQFAVKILEEDSLNPQDLTNLTAAEFIVMNIADGTRVFSITKLANEIATNTATNTATTTEVEVKDAAGIRISYTTSTTYAEEGLPEGYTETVVTVDNVDTTVTITTVSKTTVSKFSGVLTLTVSAAKTSLLTVHSKGEAVDKYYTKPAYKGTLLITFSDRSDITVVIDKITAIEVGV